MCKRSRWVVFPTEDSPQDKKRQMISHSNIDTDVFDTNEFKMAQHWPLGDITCSPVRPDDLQNMFAQTFYWDRGNIEFDIWYLLDALPASRFVQVIELHDLYDPYLHRYSRYLKKSPNASLRINVDYQLLGTVVSASKLGRLVREMTLHSVRFQCEKKSSVKTLCHVMSKMRRTKQLMIEMNFYGLERISDCVEYFKNALRKNIHLQKFVLGNKSFLSFHTVEYSRYSDDDCEAYLDRNLSISRWIDKYYVKDVKDLRRIITNYIRGCFGDLGMYLPLDLANIMFVFTYAV